MATSTINIKNLEETRHFLEAALDEVKTDTTIQRSTFAKDRFEVEETLWNVLHLLTDLRDYWHITGKINKFEDIEAKFNKK